MTTATGLLVSLLREGWTAVVRISFLVGLLGLLYTTLRSAGAALAGSRFGMASALKSGAGMSLLLLFAFTGLPELIASVQDSLATAAACDPLKELGAACATLVGAIAGMRMLVSLLRGILAAAVSGGPLSHGILDTGETLAGMLAVLLAGPIAAFFLGTCT